MAENECALPIASCVTLGKLLNFSEPQFPHLSNGDREDLLGQCMHWESERPSELELNKVFSKY